jgi:hypothetical protein
MAPPQQRTNTAAASRVFLIQAGTGRGGETVVEVMV